jgi:hypothetical protein
MHDNALLLIKLVLLLQIYYEFMHTLQKIIFLSQEKKLTLSTFS